MKNTWIKLVPGMSLLLIAPLLLAGCAKPAEETDTSDQQEAEQVVSEMAQVRPGHSLGIESVPNLRDLGGYQTSDGATVATGLIYRSNQLAHISEEDMEQIAGLGLKVDYDLRTEAEKDALPDELPEGVEYVWVNVLADSEGADPAVIGELLAVPEEANAAFGGGKAAKTFGESYRDFVSLPSAKAEYRKMFLGLGDRAQLPALFHCTTGKDRTGWAAAAFLTLLGVPRDVVMEDYLRSNDNIIPMYQEVIDQFVAAGGEESIPLAFLGVQEDYLEIAFDEMETQFGSIENYFSEGLGIDAEQQQALRDLYLQ